MVTIRQHNENYFHNAVLAMLSLGLLIGVSGTVLHWLGRSSHPLDRIFPPSLALLFFGLLAALRFSPLHNWRWLRKFYWQ